MKPIASNEWSALAASWQAGAEPMALTVKVLLRREQRRRIGMALLLAVEIVISVGSLVIGWWGARRMSSPNGAIFFGVIVLYVLLVCGFTFWNRRGTWRPLTETVEGFVAVSLLRCRRGLRTVTFTMMVVMMQALLVLGLVGVLVARQGSNAFTRTVPLLATSLSIGSMYVIWAIWYRRLMLRRLARLAGWEADAGVLALPQEGA